MCHKPAFYLFSHVNKGVPKDSCQDHIMRIVDDKSTALAKVTMTGAGIGLFSLLVSMLTCSYISQRAEDKSKDGESNEEDFNTACANAGNGNDQEKQE